LVDFVVVLVVVMTAALTAVMLVVDNFQDDWDAGGV
jgi:hypothetical protein